jgi:hypothetical protein
LEVQTVTDVLTAILVVITGFYAFVTFKMLKAMRDQIETSLRPYVTVGLVVELFPIFHLKVANEGRTSANRLRLTISHDFFSFGEKRDEMNLAKSNAFNKEIPCFSPGAELFFPLAQSFVVFGEKADPAVTPSRFSVTARYSYGDKTVEERTDVELTPYLTTWPRPDARTAELEKIREALEKVLGKPTLKG